MRRTTFAGVLAIAASLIVFSDLASMQGRRRDVQLVNGREAVAREVLVKFRDPSGAAAPAAAVGEADVEAIEAIGGTGVMRLRSRSLDAAALVAQLAARPDVLYAEPNYIVHAVSQPDDPSFAQLWGLENIGQIINGIPGTAGSDIRAVPAWDITVGSTAHVVAVIDTGIDYLHPDLAANVWSAPAPFTVDLGGGNVVTCPAGTHGFNAIARSCDPMDDHGHGTHVAGTIGATGNNGLGVTGVNWTARMMAIKFLDETGAGSVADVISGIRFAVAVKRAFPAAANVRVLSNSWGSLDFSQALLDEIGATVNEEMLFVAAAGNYGISNDVLPLFPASYAVPTVVSVAATTSRNQRAYFSNYGPTTVHLGAPGADILSTLPGNTYGFASGTSMAAPHVSGAAALVLSRCELDTAALKDALIGTVQPMEALTSTTISGGRLDVNSAIHSCIAPPEAPQNLTAGAGDGQVLLSWDASLGATSYHVKRSQTSGGPYTTIAAAVKGARFTDTAVVNGTTYYYVVSAANSLGESGNSDEASATPNTPSDLVVTALTAPEAAASGATVAVTVTTKNQGGGPASATTTRIYLSANGSYDASDLPLQAVTVAALAPGETALSSVSVTIPVETPVGVTYLVARADDGNVVPESNENNNTRWRSIAIGPDLTISAFTVPSSAAAGASIEVSDTVANKGAGSAGASTTTYYLSPNGIVDASDTLLAGSRTVPALEGGASSSGTTLVTIPAATSPGTYYMIARADGGDAVAEAVEGNNTYGRIIRVGSDLAVSSFAAPSSGGAGSVIAVTDTTTNQGAGGADATVTRFYLSANTVVDASDAALGARAVPPLAGGASSTATTSLTIPPSTPTGGYYLLAVADGDNSVVETNESNNIGFRSIAVGGDLRVTALTLPAMAAPGTAISVSDTTANQGTGPIGPTTTAYYFSTNLSFDSGDVMLGGRSVPALAAGASDTGSATVTVPPDLSAGTYYIIARADSLNAEEETKENNNDYARSFQVGGDLRVTALSAPATAGAGVAIVVSDTTANNGAATVPASVTRFYLSADITLDAADRMLDGGRAVPSLAPDASSSGSTTVTIPADVQPGAYSLFAKADGDDAVGETQEWNNTMRRTIGIGPDLIVSSIAAPAAAAPGAVVSVGETTLNQGGGSAPASVTTFFLSSDLTIDSSDVFFGASRSVGPLPAGTSSSGTTVVTIPPDTAPGMYYVIANADGGGNIAESYETNNTRRATIRIGPDLVVSAASLSSSTIQAGSSATLTHTVKNQGQGLAAGSVVAFYLSKNYTVDAADIPLPPSRVVPGLASGASSQASTIVTIPAATPTGTWYVLAQADADGVVAETLETNNVRFVRTIEITPP